MKAPSPRWLHGFLGMSWCIQAQVVEIDTLPIDAKIPISVFTSHSDQAVAKALVNRLARRVNKIEPSAIPIGSIMPVTVPLENTLQVRMRFPLDVTEKIIANGFLNQYQTATSKGVLSTDYRYNSESSWMQLPTKADVEALGESAINNLHAVLPKYGYIVSPRAPELMGDYQDLAQYGDAIAVFKPSVRNRVTMSYGDSVNYSMPYHHGYFKTFSAGRVYLGKPARYLEAQIWGRLGVSDVHEFLVPENTDAKWLHALKATGIPISFYKKPSLPQNADNDCYEPRNYRPAHNGRAAEMPKVSLEARKAYIKKSSARAPVRCRNSSRNACSPRTTRSILPSYWPTRSPRATTNSVVS